MIKIVNKSKKKIGVKTSQKEIWKILLKNRGIKEVDIKAFTKVAEADKLKIEDFGISKKSFEKSLARIEKAIKNKEKVLIYGDYDVDGITATAILWLVLKEKGVEVWPFIPDRQKDGYGLKYESFKRFEKEKNIKFDLLITVDNGIVAHRQIKKIKKEGTDIVIIDHHQKKKEKIKVEGIVHSTKTSASVLSWLMARQIDKKADLGLASLGAVADCVPLLGVNRRVVYWGLKYIKTKPNPGIKKLLAKAKVDLNKISSYHMSYIIGPRINAVGRLGDATDALRLLCSRDQISLDKYTTKLNQMNYERQKLQKGLIKNALIKAKDNQDKVIIVIDEKYHLGIIGLIAGRLSQEYDLPTIVISKSKDISKASCRSIKELNIIKSLRQVEDLLVELGGHKGAAGFSIETKKIAKFEKKIKHIINQSLEKYEGEKRIEVEAEMDIEAIDLKMARLMEKLEPTGIDNPKPLFYLKEVELVAKRKIGKDGSHLKMILSKKMVDGIAFSQAKIFEKIKTGNKLDMVASLDVNDWGGRQKVQLMIKEIVLK
ncbi:single-stranded-DNA-specific exonuclease RecJ [Candidatus Shapirobacteria bacterium]|nr:MAG: single-stranded-DNA-specific exonuclease RecJ [Candidatus Shapirobacteria bacterium]